MTTYPHLLSQQNETRLANAGLMFNAKNEVNWMGISDHLSAQIFRFFETWRPEFNAKCKSWTNIKPALAQRLVLAGWRID